MEFLYWCEDLNMEPVLAVYAGYSLKGEHVKSRRSSNHLSTTRLDEIEFVSGSADTALGPQTGRVGPSGPVQAALRRNRQRRHVRPLA